MQQSQRNVRGIRPWSFSRLFLSLFFFFCAVTLWRAPSRLIGAPLLPTRCVCVSDLWHPTFTFIERLDGGIKKYKRLCGVIKTARANEEGASRTYHAIKLNLFLYLLAGRFWSSTGFHPFSIVGHKVVAFSPLRQTSQRKNLSKHTHTHWKHSLLLKGRVCVCVCTFQRTREIRPKRFQLLREQVCLESSINRGGKRKPIGWFECRPKTPDDVK